MGRDTRVAEPFRYLLAIEVLQQRDGVFSGEARQLLEVGHIQARRSYLVFDKKFPQSSDAICVEERFIRYSYELVLSHQQQNDAPRSLTA